MHRRELLQASAATAGFLVCGRRGGAEPIARLNGVPVHASAVLADYTAAEQRTRLRNIGTCQRAIRTCLLIYAEVHRRGGVVKVHRGGVEAPHTDLKVYDYLWVGEGAREGDRFREAVKRHSPYVVPCLDMSRATISSEDELYLHALPYLQFPLRLAGRPFTGERAAIPGINYPPEERCFWTRHCRAIWKHYQTHPDGPHSYGWWDSVPGRPEAQPTHARWLKTKDVWRSKVFPETVRDYWVYVPKQYDGNKPACVMVFQDGHTYVGEKGDFCVPVVFDNLIHKGEMPVTIGVFINPGHVGEQPPQSPWQASNRSFEYDTLSDQYARLLTEEILPEVGKRYKLPEDPECRAILPDSLRWLWRPAELKAETK